MRRLAAALALIALGAPAAASADVTIGSEEIVVAAPGASATITRDPFQIRFADEAGRAVLAGLAGAPGASAPLGLDVRPQFAAFGPPPPTLYAPLSFLVGDTAIAQVPAHQWQGNLLSVTESGTEYGAEAVMGAQRRGAGVLLRVSTSDPSGRTLAVGVAPGPRRGTIEVTAVPDPLAGVAAISDSFGSPGEEAFRGFGGRHNSIDQAGEEFYNWIMQENLSSGSLSELTTPTFGADYLFPNGRHSAYYAQGSFISPGRYGFLLDRPELSHWRLRSDRPDAWQVQAFGPRLRYVVAPGRAREAIGTLTEITGRHRLPPRWALGSLLDRLVVFQGESREEYFAAIEEDLRRIRRHRIRVDGYRIEGWHFFERDALRDLIERLHRRGIKAMLYFRSFVGRDEIGTDDPEAYQEAVANGYVATNAGGSPYVFFSNFSAAGAQIDFTDPGARRWWRGRIREALELGADGFMQDFGEQVMADMHFSNGETGETMHNKIPLLYHRLTMSEVRRFERAHPKREVFFYTRSGYSGSPGSAAFEFANFPGDETTDWSRSAGLASLAPDMLSRAIGGAWGFTTDIGGFFDVGPYQPTSKELFIRWAEWAALSPFFRLHGSVGAGVHTPWSYDVETVRIYRRLVALHLSARPLIERLWRRGLESGIPPTRPLWLMYPADPAAAAQDQEWMLGPDVLVAPVVTEGATEREVYFPRGCWRAPGGGRFEGPLSATVAAPLDELPYFTRCGTDPLRRS
jgi:alpha-glucosidase (family GH31 glycosyl hydrolase)